MVAVGGGEVVVALELVLDGALAEGHPEAQDHLQDAAGGDLRDALQLPERGKKQLQQLTIMHFSSVKP